MIGLNAGLRYFLYAQPMDIPKRLDGLGGLVRNHLRNNPTDGDVYQFLNTARTLAKLPSWNRTGFFIYSKRLEQASLKDPGHLSDNPASDWAGRNWC